MRHTLSFYLYLIVSLGVIYGQSIAEKLQTHQEGYHIEKVYISHDKPVYYPGDTIWAKVFFVDGRTHKIFDAEPVLYIEWLRRSGEIIQTFNLKIKDGVSAFDIPTSRGDTAGIYIIRAYSRYQKNFSPDFIFQKEIRLLGQDDTLSKEVVADDFSVRFFPEGGDIVEGLPNRIAFEILDVHGNALDLTGKLVDENGVPIIDLKVVHEGLGVFDLNPVLGKKYKAQFSHQGIQRSFSLPDPLPTGFILQAKTTVKDYIDINLRTSSSLLNCTLVGHIRGQIFLSQTFDGQDKKQLLIKKENLPTGVLHFTLFDAQERPVCERLVYNRNPFEQVTTDINLDEEFFLRRSKVDFSFVSLLNDTIVPSTFSISVYNQDLSDSLYAGIDIVNYLSLQSDLKGRIKNIQHYFERSDIGASVLFDLLLLTHGWRRFKWKDVLAKSPQVITYPPQDDLSIYGRVKKANSEESTKADVVLSVLSNADFMALNVTTEDDGLFYFKGFQFEDTTDLFIQANVHNPKKQKKLKEGEVKRIGSKNVDIELLDLNQWEFLPSVSLPYTKNNVEDLQNGLNQITQFQKIDSAYDAQMEITLGEVTIQARRSYSERNRFMQKKFKEKNLFFFASTYKVLMDDLPDKGANYQSIYDLVRKMVPRTLVQGAGVNRTIHFRRNGIISDPALVLIDGVEMSKSRTQRLDPREIEIIDVLDGLYASVTYDAPYVVLIITRAPGTYNLDYEPPKAKGVLNHQHPGYYQAREFYSPDYSKLSVNHQRPDFRTTLYWNANGTIQKQQRQYSFYTGDIPGKYLIKIEGLTEDGLPFVGIKSFSVLE